MTQRLSLATGLAWLAITATSSAVMYNRDTGDAKSRELADLAPFASRANISGCSAVLIAPNVLLSAAHCVNYAASGTVTATWNGQTRSGAVFTNIGADHLVIVTNTAFTGTTGKMTAPYSGAAENGRLAWKVGSGGHGVIGYGSSGPFYEGGFRAMTNRIEVNNVASPPNPVSNDWLFYDNDGPPSRPDRATTLYEGGTAPGDSGGPLYMFENGRWYVIGVTSGPDAGYYRDARVRTDIGQIESITGYQWARPVTHSLEMRWVANDLTSSLADGAAVVSWPRNGGTDAWTDATADGGAGTATLNHAVTPNGTAAVNFPGTARLGLAAASNPVSSETSFTVAMVVRVDNPGTGGETNWFDNTGLIDAEESGTKNDWGLAVSSTGKPGLGIGNPNTTQYSPTGIADGQWRVIVATWDGSEVVGDAAGSDRNMSIYVDSPANVSRGHGAEFLNVNRGSVTLTLGGSRRVSRFLNGAIAEVRLYRGALDDTAVDSLIGELKNAHIGPQVGLTLSKPASGRAAVVLGNGLVIDGVVTGASSVSITQTSGPAAAVISPSDSLPAYASFPAAGIYQLNVNANQGASSVSRTVLVEVLPNGNTPPSGAGLDVTGAWTAANLGDASTSGSLSTGATTMSLTGSGKGFEEVSDSIRFAWKPLTGDGSITGRVAGFSANNGGKAYGGLMMRSSLRRESSNVAATVISGGGVRFTSRTEDAAYTEPDIHTLRAPYWVRIDRVGNTFTGYHSPDGVNWTQQGSPLNISMASTALWGLAVTSHATNSVSQTSFTNVTLAPLGGQAAPGNSWSGADIGSPIPAGSHSGGGTSFNVNGGGTDIFGDSDQFRFLSQSYSGDARLTARVASQDRTDPWAKAGVMVRASTAAGATNAFMCTTPLNGLPRQGRLTTNGPTTTDNSGTANFTAPHWLRLTRSGDDFTCFRSTDGSNWFQLGPVRRIPDAPDTVFAGVMIASLNNSGNSVVSMDNLSVVETGPASALPEMFFPPGQNPSTANSFTLSASATGGPTWSWQKVSGPGDLIFRTQNTASPQTAFTQEGSYVIRAIAETSDGATFIEQTQDLHLDARWDFNTDNNSEGWNPNNSSIVVADGVLTGTSTSNDPQLTKSGAVYVSGSLVKHIAIRYRGSSTGTAQLFWGRVGAGGFSGNRVVNFPMYSTADTWREIIANPSAHADWNGREIIDLRFDPTGGSGSSHEIDWIALYSQINRTWVGTTNANWGDASNWNAAAVPTSSDSAVFNGAGNGNTIINLGNTARVADSVVFTTASTAAYTFHNNTGLTLTITGAGGESLAIRSGVSTSQDLSGIANLRPSDSNGSFNVINNGSGTLTLPTWIGWGNRTQVVVFDGSGLIEVKGAGIQSRQSGNNVSVTKNGVGTLVIHGGGTVNPGSTTQGRYNGATTINAGVLRVRHNFALGTTASGTTVASGAALELQETTGLANLSVGEPLTLNGSGISDGGALRNLSGNNTLTGPVTLASDTRIHSDADSLTLGNAISGDFNLTLGGAGTIILAGTSTYTGTTTHAAGTLHVSGELGATNVTVESSAMIGGDGTLGGNLHLQSGADLKFSPTETLTVNGATVSFDGFGIENLSGFGDDVPVGTYFLLDGAATVNTTNLANLGAANAHVMGETGNQAYFETDSLNLQLVVSGPATDAYADWITTKGLTGTAAAFDADPDGDGIANGLEFVLGGEPNPANPNSNSLHLLPTVESQGSDLVFTYSRSNDSAYLNPTVEFSADLKGSWTTAVHGTNATIEVTDGSLADTVTVTIPKNGAPTLFARLRVVQAAP